jgi:hypothetical protein
MVARCSKGGRKRERNVFDDDEEETIERRLARIERKINVIGETVIGAVAGGAGLAYGYVVERYGFSWTPIWGLPATIAGFVVTVIVFKCLKAGIK